MFPSMLVMFGKGLSGILSGLLFFLLSAQAADPLFLALHMAPGPGVALMLLAPAAQGHKGKGQSKDIQQHIQQPVQPAQGVQGAHNADDEPRFHKEQAVLPGIFGKVLGLDGVAPLVAPDPGIFHHRVAIIEQHHAAGQLKTKKHLSRLVA